MILKKIIHYPATNSVEATWVDDDDVPVRCHSYADVQMDRLEADLGADAPAYSGLIATVRASIVPPIAPSRDSIIAARWSAIKAERDRRIDTGGYQAAGKWFHSDMVSRSQQLGLVLLGANIPAGLQWKTMDGSFVLMTPSLAQQILAAGAASDQAIFAAAEAHRAAMGASADPGAYDFSADWPTTFLG